MKRIEDHLPKFRAVVTAMCSGKRETQESYLDDWVAPRKHRIETKLRCWSSQGFVSPQEAGAIRIAVNEWENQSLAMKMAVHWLVSEVVNLES